MTIIRVFAGVLLCIAFANAQQSSVQPGGSVFGWYGPSGGGGCLDSVNDNYHVVIKYDVDTITINNILGGMKNQNQKRLGIPLYVGCALTDPNAWNKGDGSGTVINTCNGILPQRFKTNLLNLIITAHDAYGFQEFLVSLHQMDFTCSWLGKTSGCLPDPVGYTAPNTLGGVMSDLLFQKHWNLTYDLMTYLNNNLGPRGILYRMDLGNELGDAWHAGTPAQYFAKGLWGNVVSTGLKSYSVGFSFGALNPNTSHLQNIYSGNYPYWLAVHNYTRLGTTHIDDAGLQMRDMDTKLKAAGIYAEYILGEAYYNDAQEAQSLWNNAAPYMSIRYLLQWPIQGTPNCMVDVAPPTAYNNYHLNHW